MIGFHEQHQQQQWSTIGNFDSPLKKDRYLFVEILSVVRYSKAGAERRAIASIIMMRSASLRRSSSSNTSLRLLHGRGIEKESYVYCNSIVFCGIDD